MINWGPYLESVCREYDRWWEVYTLTDVAGKKPHEQGQNIFPSFDLGLMVQRVKSEEKQGKDPQEKIERLTVLEGLRKYAANHVLLVGRPGSGKSTALARLLLEEAHKVWSGENGQIPILIELRYSKSSVLSRIQAFIDKHNHNTYIDEETLKSLLLQGKFLLLFDGFNEMASEEARQQVRMFRQDYPETAMVFSTRDLSLGGDLRIEKKLEMQPLTESQMQDFVCAYLPEQGENLWGQLQGRLRELGETPMFLLMLCSVFDYNKVIPAHLGLVFRGFTQTYSGRIKQDVLVDESSRRWWDRLLQELAWVMTTGGSKTEMMVAIPRKKAEDVLADFLRGQVVAPTDCAMGWLEDLLEYHLIQVGDDGQISFRHQLLQEYYAAERLSSQLSGLSDYELQWDYLNYLKWTEVVALMLGLVEDEVLAVRVVRLALEVDWFLGARLVGEVKEKFQEAAFAEVDGLELPGLAKVVLAGLTMSEVTVPRLVQFLEHSDKYMRGSAAHALGKIASEKAIEELIPLLKDSDEYVRWSAAYALGEIGSETAIEGLIPLLKDSDSFVCWSAANAMGKIGSQKAIEGLIPLLKDSDSFVRYAAAEALGKIDSEKAIEGLIPLLKDSDPNVNFSARSALSQIGSEKAIEQLIPLLKDSDEYVRYAAAEALGKIGSEKAIEQLIPLLKDSDSSVRSRAVYVLGKIGSEKAIEGLIPLLKDSDEFVRYTAAEALGKIGSEKAIEQLIPLLKDSDPNVRRNAAYALGEIGSEKAIEGLIPLLKDSDSFVRSRAAYVLGEIGSEKAIEQLIPLLKDSDYWVRDHVAEALGKIGSENTIIKLTKKLQNDSFVKQDLYKIIKIIQTIQQRLQYYKPTPKIPMSKSLSHNYALLIGVGDYKYPDWSLPVTVKDVQAIKSFLTNPDLCSYIDDENHLRLLCNEQATKQNILNNINWLQEQAKNDPEATILVYYSGHGWLDKSTEKYYLIPHDTSPIKLQKTQKTALPATDFNNALQEISAQKLLVIIDSCHAQGMATAKETDQLDLPENFSQTALPKNLIEDLKKGTGRAVFTSSTGYQLSWIRSDQTMSIYTYHLLEALQGGDNKPGDKYVTLSNLMHHVGKTVPQSAQQQGGEQTPIFDFSQTEDFPVALLRGGKGLPAEGKEKIQLEAQENIRNAITVQQGNAAGGDVKNQVFIDKIEGGGGITFS